MAVGYKLYAVSWTSAGGSHLTWSATSKPVLVFTTDYDADKAEMRGLLRES